MALTKLTLTWIGNSPKGNTFSLELGDDWAMLSGPDGNTVAHWTLEEATRCFAVPGLFSEAKRFTISAANGSMKFKTTRADRKIIRHFLDTAICNSDEEAVSGLRTSALRRIGFGSAALGVAVILVFISYQVITSRKGGYIYFPLGFGAFGAINLIRGLELWRRYCVATHFMADKQLEVFDPE